MPEQTRCRPAFCPTVLAAAVAGLLVAVSGSVATAQEAVRESNAELCLEALSETYGVAEVGRVTQRKSRNRRWVRAWATLEDGSQVLFRCQVRYGELRGVTQRAGADWVDAQPVPKEDEPPEEIATRDPAAGSAGPGAAPDEGAAAPDAGPPEAAEPEDGAGPSAAEAETEQDGGDAAEAEAEDGAESDAAEAVGDDGLPLATFKTIRVNPGASFSPSEGITCYRKRRSCYDVSGRFDLEATARQFP